MSNRTKTRDKALVVDLECSCWRGRPPKGQRNEIIEIGICTIDFKTREIDNKQSLIIKNHESEISPFCTKLTSITQKLIDEEGIEFSEACRILRENYKSQKRIWFSWGNFDKNQFIKDCEHKKIAYPMSQFHFNAKTLYGFKYKMREEPGVMTALKHSDMQFEGNQHRGVDDAYNIAKIVRKIFENN